jgi:tetratricopeptide (TPR) repeat protein
MSLSRKTSSRNASPASRGAVAPANRASPFRLIALLLLGLVLIGGAFALRSSRGMRETILRGKALPELEAEARGHPDDALAQYYLAKSYYLHLRFSDARSAYEAAIRLDPNSARAHLGLALSLYESGRLREAEDAFVQTLRLDNRSAWSEYMIGKIAWLQGRLTDALPHMQRATQLDPRSDPAWFGLGVCYEQLHRYNDAVEPLRQAIAHREISAQYHTALGEVLVYRGYTDEGRKHYERALQLNPDYGPACQLMGGFYLHKVPGRDSLNRAEELLLRATHLRAYHPEQLYLDLGELYAQKGQYKQAVEALQESIREDPRDERAYYALATAYRHLGNARAAAAAEQQFKRISDRHNQLQTQEARVFHNPNNAAARLSLARLYRDLGLTTDAAKQYAAYLHLEPNASGVAHEFETWIEQARAALMRKQQDSDMRLP